MTTKKEFALSQLAPYLKDPSTCGIDRKRRFCEYITSDNKMCVAGKNMINPPKNVSDSIEDLFTKNGGKQDGVLKPEVVGILTNIEWYLMQTTHDAIALNRGIALNNELKALKFSIFNLNLFTYEELVEYAEKL